MLPLGILDNAADRYGSDFIAKAAALEQYPLDTIVAQVVSRDALDSNRAEEAKSEFLQYISLVLLAKGRIAPPRLADIFWHRFIVNTSKYAKFCESIFGKFIHHAPETGSKTGDTKSVELTMSLFKEIYGKDLKVDSSSGAAPGLLMASWGKECNDGGDDGYA